MKELKISDDFSLPLGAITQTFAILAMRGAGKSNTAVVMAEEMQDSGLPFVAIDPKGDWWGIRSSGDGKGPGLAIPVFGGLHGDVPLEPTGGPLMADLIVDRRLTAILDVSEFSKGEQTRFLTAFAERLFRRNTDPLHLFLEECDDYIPQRVTSDQARLVYWFGKIVKQGRTRGLGCTLITQRSAVLNKDVLTQIETLIVMRTTAPQDRKAILSWVVEHAMGKELVDSLPALENGEAWIWSPHWLRETGKTKFRQRRTFDSGKTPTMGKARPPAKLAELDLNEIRAAMADTIEKAKADDPQELRRRIADLEARIAKQPVPQATVERVEIPVITDEQRLAIEGAAEQMQAAHETIQSIHQKNLDIYNAWSHNLGVIGVSIADLLKSIKQRQETPTKPTYDVRRAPLAKVPASLAEKFPPRHDGDAKLDKAHKRVLLALYLYGQVKNGHQLALLSGYRYNGHFRNVLGDLRRAGMLTGENTGEMSITNAGGAETSNYEPRLSTPTELREYWLQQFDKAGKAILQALCDYPHGMDHKGLCEATGYSYNGHFRNVLGDLRGAGVLIGPNTGTMRAAPELL
ncbi:MAG: ATP-binding protein [Sulfuricaulis sp.]